MNTIVTLTKPTVNAEVVERLEALLEEARAGEVVGILIVSQNRVGTARYGVYGLKDRFTTLGFLSHAMHQLQTDVPGR